MKIQQNLTTIILLDLEIVVVMKDQNQNESFSEFLTESELILKNDTNTICMSFYFL